MTFLIAILTLVLVGLVVFVVTTPLRRARTLEPPMPDAHGGASAGGTPAAPDGYTREELEAEREAKYREIRDTELDFRTGKLSREDYRAVDADLRAEAIEILNRLDEQADRPDAGAEDSAE